MSLKHALLGLLTYQPMTGYELKQFFDSTVKHFWNAELSQIYPTLKALEEHGFVDMEVAVQENRPNRKVYRITDNGRDELQRWAREPMPASGQRDAFLIKVFFGTELPAEDMLVLLRRQMEEHQKLLAFDATVMRERIRHGCTEPHFSKKHGLYWTLTLEMSMAYRRAYIQWCEDSMKMLEEALLEEGPSKITAEFAEHEDHDHIEEDAVRSG
jgi:DNA-binding PadR family transcriptional regulator